MGIKQEQSDHRYLLRCAQAELGVTVRAVNFSWDILQRLEKRLRLVRRTGLDSIDPLVEIDTSRSGIDMDAGIAHYRLPTVEPPIDLLHVVCDKSGGCGYARYDFWAVAVSEYDRLFQYVRQRNRRATRQTPPIMTPELQTRLYDHTIGFLRKSVAVLRKYGVAQRRGVLLSGEPGNGKTMAARWLRHECRRHRLAWKSITADQYEAATDRRELGQLFHLRRPGIAQFDDLDRHLRDRDQVGTTGGHMALLTELDGIEPRRGVVFLFTSNARLTQLDPAIRRPGRIDQIIEFPRPCAKLRARLIRETWHSDLTGAIDFDRAVRETDGLSFADIDEVKKLLVLGFLDREVWDWAAAWRAFCAGRESSLTRPIGFGSPGALPARMSTGDLDVSASVRD